MTEPFVSLDVKVLLQRGVSPNEYVFCSLINNQLLAEAAAFLNTFYESSTETFLSDLESKRFVKLGYDNTVEIHKIYLRSPILSILEGIKTIETGFFDEFKALYPKTTPNGRRLHSNLVKTKKKYDKIVNGNLELHEKILKAVKLEVADRTLSNSLDYMQNISTYVNNENWNVYFEDINNGRTITTSGPNRWVKTL